MVRSGVIAGIAAILATAAIGVQAEPRQVKIDARIFERYVGYYQLAPDLVLTVTREGEHLLIQNTRGPRVELFPSSDREYFYKEIPVQISFETGPRGQAIRRGAHWSMHLLTRLVAAGSFGGICALSLRQGGKSPGRFGFVMFCRSWAGWTWV